MERFDRRQALMLSGSALAVLVADGLTGPSAAKKAGKRWFYPKPGTVKHWHGENLHYFKLSLPPDAYPIGKDFGSIYGLQGTKGLNIGTHNGIDIIAPEGCPIIAADAGIVAISRWDAYSGHLVRIKPHPNNAETNVNENIPDFLRTLENESPYVSTEYWHLKMRCVREGETVKRGDVLGALGNTGSSSTTPIPHLHFQAISGGEIDDPNYYWLGVPSDLRFLKKNSDLVVKIPLFRPNEPGSTYATPPESLQRLTYPLPSVNDVEYFRKIMRGMKKVR